MSSVDDWAQGVVSRRSPPPPPPPPLGIAAGAATISSLTVKTGQEDSAVAVTWSAGTQSVPSASDPSFFVTCVASGALCPTSPTFDISRPESQVLTDVTGLSAGTSYDCYVVAKSYNDVGVCSLPESISTEGPALLSNWKLVANLNGIESWDLRANLFWLGAVIRGSFSAETEGLIFEKGGTTYGVVLYIYQGVLYVQGGRGSNIGGSLELSYTVTSSISKIEFGIDFKNQWFKLAVNGLVVDEATQTSYTSYAAGGDLGGTGKIYGAAALYRGSPQALTKGTVTSCAIYTF
ncbi:hypothetical protein M9434_004370 [Picochlorum sp. BPE23]|nr:hypothetical protein M9434_004370 [Picochlorum sp. BPE23]